MRKARRRSVDVDQNIRALRQTAAAPHTPGSVANSGRTGSAPGPAFRLPSASAGKHQVPTGTLPASNRITNGGTVRAA